MSTPSDGAASAALPLRTSDPRTIGGYTLSGRLGSGGQGVVYLGHGEDGSPVAVKLLHSHGDLSAQRAMAKELAAAQRVAAFCTARVLASGVEGDDCYLVTEYVEGPSLLRTVRDSGPLTGTDLDRLAVGTATALVAIHDAAIVHRDLKPANVLLAADGPRVIDFGISRALDAATGLTSDVVGTPAYMAPEQLAGRPGGAAADVFAWADLIVFAATGRPPFGEDSIPAVITRVLHEPPRLDGVPDHLRDVLTACLAKSPDRRPTAATLLRTLLDRTGLASPPAAPPVAADLPPTALARAPRDATLILSEGAAVAAAMGPPPPPLPVAPGFRRAVLALGAALLVAAVIGGAFWVRGLRSHDQAVPIPQGRLAGTAGAGPTAGPTAGTTGTDGEESPQTVLAATLHAMSSARTASFELTNQQSEGEYELRATGDLSFDGSGSTGYRLTLDKGCALAPVGATLIGNTAYSSLYGSPDTFDISPGTSYPGDDGCLAGLAQSRWASTPYNIATLLRLGRDIGQTHGPDGLVLRGSVPTSALTSGNPSAPLFSAYANAPFVVFRIELTADHLPRQVEFHFAMSVGDGARLDAAFTTTYTQWGMAPPVERPS
ncbi:serine/threonine-protein kinase [Actinomadura gamaensis]|uniref:Serine/threonine-protein kinase n=1 Tax=Actinomadura gamaensis TaxID=1763541 RepID=A0ABV9TZ31_9ACTN